MIGYFDSSSIVKWFFDEPYWQSARKARDTVTFTFTSQITYPEVMSAINRAWQDDRCTKLESQAIQEDFRTIWPDFKWVLIDEILIHEAGEIIFKHNLRGFDAIHLASALRLKKEFNKTGIAFSCFDHRLNEAAKNEALLIHEEFQAT